MSNKRIRKFQEALTGFDLGDATSRHLGSALIGYTASRTSAIGRTLHNKLGDVLSVADFGATGSGDETTKITNAINAANSEKKGLVFTPGKIYTVTPGQLPVANTNIFAKDSGLQAADATDGHLLAWQDQQSRTANGSPTGYTVEIGILAGSSSFSGVGTGLWVKGAARCLFIVHHAAWLKYGVHGDVSWNTVAPVAPIFENQFWLKLDSCDVGLQLSTHSVATGIPLADNGFFLGNSFNHEVALVRCTAGTNVGTSEIQNNRFVSDLLEIPQVNSDGYTFTGLTKGNQIFIYNQRGINGTGKYGRTDADSVNNYWEPAILVPSDWSFGSAQVINGLRALISGSNVQGRSYFFGPDVSTAVGSLPVQAGDRVVHTDGAAGDNTGWTRIGAAWEEDGLRKVPYFGMTGTAGIAAGATRYFPISGAADAAALNDIQTPCSSNSTARKFRVRSSAAPGVGQTFTIKLYKNSGSVVTVTISGAATTGSDTSTTAAIAEADTLAWEVVASAGTPANTIIQASLELLAAA